MRLLAMVGDSNAMLWDFDAILCYGVCSKRYGSTDCIFTSSYQGHSDKL